MVVDSKKRWRRGEAEETKTVFTPRSVSQLGERRARNRRLVYKSEEIKCDKTKQIRAVYTVSMSHALISQV